MFVKATLNSFISVGHSISLDLTFIFNPCQIPKLKIIVGHLKYYSRKLMWVTGFLLCSSVFELILKVLVGSL